MVCKELFIESRGDFSKKDGISIVLEGLVLLSEPAVHRVAGFVGQSENVREDVRLVIHQYVRRIAITGRRKGATLFPFLFIAVHPARSQSVAECAKIFLAQRLQCFQDEIDCLLERDFCPNNGNHRDKSVVLVNLIQLQDFSAEFVVVVKNGGVFTYGCEEVVIDSRWNVVAKKRCFTGRRIVSNIRRKYVGSYGGRESR